MSIPPVGLAQCSRFCHAEVPPQTGTVAQGVAAVPPALFRGVTVLRPFEDCTNEQLGDEFAAAVRMGGRPVVRAGMQVSYADMALELVLDEFRARRMLQRAAELAVQALGDVDEYGDVFSRSSDDTP